MISTNLNDDFLMKSDKTEPDPFQLSLNASAMKAGSAGRPS